jgi:hypothetical protein
MEIQGRYQRPADMRSQIKYEVEHPHFNFGPGQRHAIEVDYHTFRNELKKELKKAGVDIGRSPAGKLKQYKNYANF